MDLEPIEDKFKAFKWNVIRINGHDMDQILNALKTAKSTKGKPTVVIADTIKGKGVSFMETDNKWHGVSPNKDELERAIKEIEKGLK
jgi:transketolase